VLEELGLTYNSKYLDFQKGEHKGEEHVKLNPNGRIPTLIDHKNGDYTIWYVGYRSPSPVLSLIGHNVC
jgi:glutathione S-transferase